MTATSFTALGSRPRLQQKYLSPFYFSDMRIEIWWEIPIGMPSLKTSMPTHDARKKGALYLRLRGINVSPSALEYRNHVFLF